jgi:hypothetical protein
MLPNLWVIERFTERIPNPYDPERKITMKNAYERFGVL